MINEPVDLRTPLQKARDERNQQIYEEYLWIKEVIPADTPKWSVWRSIGEKFGLKPQGIRSVIAKIEQENGNTNSN